jgi:hypothetical protein
MCWQLSERLSLLIIGQKRSLHAMFSLSPSKQRYIAEDGNEEELEPLSSNSVQYHPLGAMQGT